jgi:hypothetical protein
MRLDTLEVPDLELAGALEAGEKSAYRLEDLLVDLREKERSAHVARVARESERILEQSTTAEVLRIVETDGKDGDRR